MGTPAALGIGVSAIAPTETMKSANFELLRPKWPELAGLGGRCAVVVPDGVLFGALAGESAGGVRTIGVAADQVAFILSHRAVGRTGRSGEARVLRSPVYSRKLVRSGIEASDRQSAIRAQPVVAGRAEAREADGGEAGQAGTVAFNQQINVVTPSPTTDPCFLYMLLLLSKPLVQRSSTASMKGMVSKGKFEHVEVIDVPPEAQKGFGNVFKRILAAADHQHGATMESETLFNCLVQGAFWGDLL